MIVTSIRIGATLKGDDGSFRKTEIEASPSEGQTAEDLLSEVRELVQSTSNGAKKETGSPIAGKETAKPAMKPVHKTTEGEYVQLADEPKEPAKKRGRKPKTETTAPDVGALLTSTLTAETLEDLLQQFNQLRDAVPSGFDVEKWNKTLDKVSARYKKLHTLDSEQKTVDNLTAAFKAERLRVAKRTAEVASRETEAVA